MAPRAEMPLFPCEVDIARAVLGPGRVSEWKAIAIILERQGLPRVDPMFGGRYWPAVRAWFDHRAGIGPRLIRAVPDGKENWDPPPGRRPPVEKK
ncbi:hypothetical protein V5F41_07705 [Xanthobacter autotrophicus]|uniref:hypothetical protein n=1 Tax=Xanthobacter autotrophicus TaxID=280 RepID=UPI0037278820